MSYGHGWKRHKRREGHGKTKKPGRNYHHIRAKSRGGDNSDSNLLLINIERHRSWHILFRLLNISEAIELLQRIKRAKEAQDGKPVRYLQAV